MMKLGLVVPCYNEEEGLAETIKILSKLLDDYILEKLISDDSFIVLVDDGSKDKTWSIIENSTSRFVKGIKLTRNKGHQNALLAGLSTFYQQADALISIDADLQDDVNAIKDMINEYGKGNHIVYGVRNNRKSDSFFKRFSAKAFYKVMKFFGAKTIDNHADFRLMSKEALSCLMQYQEVNLFLRGIVLEIGYSSSIVYYKRLKRTKGTSKYPLRKMLAFAWNGITSFSNKPIKYVRICGIRLIFLTIIAAITLFVLHNLEVLYIDTAWLHTATIIFSILIASGLNMIALGVVGEYVGKVHQEVKQRPRFFIEKIIDKSK